MPFHAEKGRRAYETQDCFTEAAGLWRNCRLQAGGFPSVASMATKDGCFGGNPPRDLSAIGSDDRNPDQSGFNILTAKAKSGSTFDADQRNAPHLFTRAPRSWRWQTG